MSTNQPRPFVLTNIPVTKRKTTMHAITIPAIPPPERPVEKSSCSISATQ
jgi:hypothetical protein